MPLTPEEQDRFNQLQAKYEPQHLKPQAEIAQAKPVVGQELAPVTPERALEIDRELGVVKPEGYVFQPNLDNDENDRFNELRKKYEGFEPVKRDKYKGFWNEFGRATTRGTLNVGAGIAGTVPVGRRLLEPGYLWRYW